MLGGKYTHRGRQWGRNLWGVSYILVVGLETNTLFIHALMVVIPWTNHLEPLWPSQPLAWAKGSRMVRIIITWINDDDPSDGFDKDWLRQ